MYTVHTHHNIYAYDSDPWSLATIACPHVSDGVKKIIIIIKIIINDRFSRWFAVLVVTCVYDSIPRMLVKNIDDGSYKVGQVGKKWLNIECIHDNIYNLKGCLRQLCIIAVNGMKYWKEKSCRTIVYFTRLLQVPFFVKKLLFTIYFYFFKDLLHTRYFSCWFQTTILDFIEVLVGKY